LIIEQSRYFNIPTVYISWLIIYQVYNDNHGHWPGISLIMYQVYHGDISLSLSAYIPENVQFNTKMK